MKKIISAGLAFFTAIYMTACNTENSSATDSITIPTKNEIKSIVLRDNLYRGIYDGHYIFPDYDESKTIDNIPYYGILVRYSDISDEMLDSCEIIWQEFVLNKNDENDIKARLPFTTLQELKNMIETVETHDYAQSSLYDFCDGLYYESGEKLYRNFYADLIYAYSIDFNDCTVSLSGNEIKVLFKGILHEDKDNVDVEYTMIFSDNTWKISSLNVNY